MENTRNRSSKASSSSKSVKEISKENGKLKRTLNEIVVEMTATDEELEYRKSKLIENDVVERSLKFFRCTKCHKSYKETINDGQPVQVHPFLGVLMCENCCDYYGDGNFSLGSDGEDKYCRWCGEGGTILTCSKCIYGFCAVCIKKHFGIERLKQVKKDDDWLCFFCNPKPLWELRFVCSLAEQVSETQETEVLSVNAKENSQNSNVSGEFWLEENEKTKEDPNISKKSNKKVSSDEEFSLSQEELSAPVKNSQSSIGSQSQDFHILKNAKSSTHQNRKRIEKRRSLMYLSSSEEADEDQRETPKKRVKLSTRSTVSNSSFLTIKTKVLEKLQKILKLAEYQTTFATNWSNKTLTKLGDQNQITSKEELVKECQKIKWFLSMLSSHLVEFCNSVSTIEKFLSGDSKTVINDIQHLPSDESPYTNVLLFLNFISNQVKTFMDKGISFQDVLEAEVYNDTNVLGIKKKGNASINNDLASKAKNDESKQKKKTGNHKNTVNSDSETEISESEKLTSTNQSQQFGFCSTNSEDVSKIIAILENA